MYQEYPLSSMATEGQVDTTRTNVQTYVPAYQKGEWAEHADELDMSLSEFVRSMVQAGRRGFTDDRSNVESSSNVKPSATPSSNANPEGKGLEDRVADILSEEGFADWDELVAALTDDFEERLEATLQEMQADGRVQYSGRSGGYTLV